METIISLGEHGGYYGYSPQFRVQRIDDGSLNFWFSPSGWDFDTPYMYEAAAIIALSKLKGTEALSSIPAVALTDKESEEAAYWMSGGTRAWRFGDRNIIGSWEDNRLIIAKQLRACYGDELAKCKTMYDIVLAFRKYDNDGFILHLMDEEPQLFEDEEEEE